MSSIPTLASQLLVTKPGIGTSGDSSSEERVKSITRCWRSIGSPSFEVCNSLISYFMKLMINLDGV